LFLITMPLGATRLRVGGAVLFLFPCARVWIAKGKARSSTARVKIINFSRMSPYLDRGWTRPTSVITEGKTVFSPGKG